MSSVSSDFGFVYIGGCYHDGEKKNKLLLVGRNLSPRGIKWSAVPLPCSTVFFYGIFLSDFNGSRAAAPVGDEVL